MYSTPHLPRGHIYELSTSGHIYVYSYYSYYSYTQRLTFQEDTFMSWVRLDIYMYTLTTLTTLNTQRLTFHPLAGIGLVLSRPQRHEFSKVCVCVRVCVRERERESIYIYISWRLRIRFCNRSKCKENTLIRGGVDFFAPVVNVL